VQTNMAVIPGPPAGSGLWPAQWAEPGIQEFWRTAAWIPGSRKKERAPE
jgi:hypothetical protein